VAYIKPEDVVAPQIYWKQEDILVNQGESTDEEIFDRYSIATGYWQGNRCLGIRLNGSGAKRGGYPVPFGNPAWLVVPVDLHHIVLSIVPAPTRARATHFLATGSTKIAWQSADRTNNEYVAPAQATSMSGRCKINDVLLDQGPSLEDGAAKYSVALGAWGNQPSVLIRWNGVPETAQAKGMPLAGSSPSWFPLPVDVDRWIQWASKD
jgi:hypothetical protein